jgi:CheY-like chemotaxis protein
LSVSKRIFVVHREPDQLQVVVHRLKANGHQVTIHDRGIGASGAIARDMPDLIILAIDTSFIDCGALCALLRQDPKLAAVPVLLLSNAMSEADVQAKAIAVGAQGGLVGSVTPAQLLKQVEDYLLRKRPLLPATEAKRMQNLQRYRVLDTTPEPVFDDLSRVASIVCETPIAVLSLVDAKRQWFKSKVGLGATETPREHAFCAHAIHSGEILEVADATLDVRFEDNPLVTKDPNIRFYAGAPLTAPDGTAAGTLCVIDRVPRRLTAQQRVALAALARVATYLLESRADRANH